MSVLFVLVSVMGRFFFVRTVGAHSISLTEISDDILCANNASRAHRGQERRECVYHLFVSDVLARGYVSEIERHFNERLRKFLTMLSELRYDGCPPNG